MRGFSLFDKTAFHHYNKYSFNLSRRVMFSLIVALFIILNPASTVPTYVSMYPRTKTKQLIRDSSMIAIASFIILSVAAVGWTWILHLFWLDIEYFRIAGGLVIGWVAWNMAQGKTNEITIAQQCAAHDKKCKLDRGLIIPLVMPMTAGPGSIAFIISQAGESSTIQLLIAITVASIAVYFTMRYGSILLEKLGDSGIKLMTRIIGILLLGIALQIIIGTILTLV